MEGVKERASWVVVNYLEEKRDLVTRTHPPLCTLQCGILLCDGWEARWDSNPEVGGMGGLGTYLIPLF